MIKQTHSAISPNFLVMAPSQGNNAAGFSTIARRGGGLFVDLAGTIGLVVSLGFFGGFW